MKYSYVEMALMDKEKRYADCIEQEHIVVIDTREIGVFDARSKQVSIITALDRLKSRVNLTTLRNKIISFIWK
jgi:hypothetical protein